MSRQERTGRPMRILFIGKRFYTNRDAFKERFGRIYQLPYWWAAAGQEVDLWLIDYHSREAARCRDDSIASREYARFRWSFLRTPVPCLAWRQAVVTTGYRCRERGLLCWPCSPTWWLVSVGRSFVFDVYDRYDVYEGYRRLPGFDPLSFLLRRSSLLHLPVPRFWRISSHWPGGRCWCMNGVDPARFAPLPMHESRASLGLPAGVPLVGYFGSMEPERGISDLIDAVALLGKDRIDIKLIIGGKADPAVNLDHPSVHYLGNLAFAQMPVALASCDLLALPYRQGVLGR